MFDLDNDPGEWNNLCGDPAHAEIEAELRSQVLETFDPDAIEEAEQTFPVSIFFWGGYGDIHFVLSLGLDTSSSRRMTWLKVLMEIGFMRNSSILALA